MDQSLLAARNIHPAEATMGHVDGYRLHIGRRASLLPDKGSRSYGLLMKVAASDIETLYSDASVADYVKETVVVELPDGREVQADCYNLPADKMTGTNPGYAAALLDLVIRLGMPESYIGHIRKALVTSCLCSLSGTAVSRLPE